MANTERQTNVRPAVIMNSIRIKDISIDAKYCYIPIRSFKINDQWIVLLVWIQSYRNRTGGM